MKKLVALLLDSMMATVAFAGLDPDFDSFGIYVDPAGMANCGPAGPFQATPVYLLLMNPRSATNGFECVVTAAGVSAFNMTTALGGAGPIDVDGRRGANLNGFAVGCASNYVPANGAIVLATMTYMLMAPGELAFYIGQAQIPSMPGGLPVVTGDGVLRRCGVASGNVNLPVGGFNLGGACPISEEVSSFGEVKSLFR
ncbi:hypothetical protein FJ250_08655 [bacterium]|nr:hypothetical protein [bacterium]